MQNFDPALFLQQGQKAVANATFVPQCPPGDYQMVIDSLKAEQFPGVKDPSKTYTKVKFGLAVNDPGVQALLKRDKVVVFHDFLLEMTEDGSGIDMGEGKNVGLGRMRAAAGLNQPGIEWNFGMFVGRPVLGHVEHEMYNGESYAKCTKVTKV